MTEQENKDLQTRLLKLLILLSCDFLNENAQKVLEYLIKNFDVLF